MKLSGAELLCSAEMSGHSPLWGHPLALGDLSSGLLLLKVPMFKGKAMKGYFYLE